jgi:hypothetical protein
MSTIAFNPSYEEREKVNFLRIKISKIVPSISQPKDSDSAHGLTRRRHGQLSLSSSVVSSSFSSITGTIIPLSSPFGCD